MKLRAPSIVLLASTLALTAGCSSSSQQLPLLAGASADKTQTVVVAPDQAALKGQPSGYLRMNIKWPERGGRSTQSMPATTSQFRLTVTASDLIQPITTLISRDADAASASIQLTVPSGTGRSLMVEGLNTAGKVVATATKNELSVSVGQYTQVAVGVASIVGNAAGTVLNQETGKPVANALVTYGDQSILTDADGHYRFDDLDTGVQILSFSKNHYDLATCSIAVVAGNTTNAGNQPIAPRHWIPQASGVNMDLTGIIPISSTEAWAYGNTAGSLIRTTDGGATWQPVYLDQTVPGDGVAFANSTTGYAFHADKIYKTTDGGNTWTATSFTAKTIRDDNTITSISTIDPDTFLANSANPWRQYTRTIASLDGGTTFTVRLQDPVNTLFAISKYSYLMTDRYRLLMTTSTGDVWSEISLPLELPGNGIGYSNIGRNSLNELFLAGMSNVAGEYKRVVAKSTDGGASWFPVYTSDSTASYSDFRGASGFGTGACAVGFSGAVEMLYPSMQTWRKVPIDAPNPSEFNLNAVGFFDTKTGWAVGEHGKILKY